ncbi:MAG TPA: carbohydrate binding domain-containing protein [Pyrinomonadaceae bacterium]|nr:carbohydrate binding domain-containing protein [Pyrinomonadaceae bacterium]
MSLFCAVSNAQSNKLVVADFDRGENLTNLGESFGTWDKDANDATQSCKMSFAKDDALGEKNGKSLELDYDVDSPNPAYNGFWLKISNAKIAEFETLGFYLKGDADKGFTSKIKIELKDKNNGKGTFFVENITNQWQKISLTLGKRNFSLNQTKPLEEFVIVFDDINSSPKTGRIYFDQIEFSKN